MSGSGGDGDGPGALTARERARLTVSPLTLKIVMANLIGLVILLIGSFALNQYRDGLIQAKLEGVRAQAQIMADVLGQVAIDEAACEVFVDQDASPDSLPSPICPLALSRADVRSVFNRVWDSFEGRIRIFNAPQSSLDPPVSDANALVIEDVVLRRDTIEAEPLPPIRAKASPAALRARIDALADWLSAGAPGGFRREAAARTIEAELNRALQSSPFADERGAASVRVNENGELVASVSVPIRRVQAIYGLVTAEIGGIDDLVARARWSVLPFFGLAIAAAILSSLLLTTAIAQPIRQLALSADKVREGVSAAGRSRIPDFAGRKDEIGELSTSLRSMTQALYDRMEAIESFAADVAHELKNPLTSIRSATETLEIAKTPEAKEKLMGLIQNDVARMNRLITDISNASRLDAELARQGREAIDLRRLLGDIVGVYGATQKDGQAPVIYDQSGVPVYIFANSSALGQVFRNLIDNARSFSPPGGDVRLHIERTDDGVRVCVDDDGPGVPEEAMQKIFSRFYTKRPQGAAFGANSGLGLAISKQIVASHGGDIWVTNRKSPTGGVAGARFIVNLPSA